MTSADRAPAAPGAPVRRPTPRRRVAAAVLGAIVLLAGCTLRLESAPPAERVPDQLESVRQRTTADAVALQVLADRLAAAPAPTDPAADPGAAVDPALVAAEAAAVAAASRQHVEALGGTYVAFPDASPSGEPTSPSTSTASPPTGEPEAPEPQPSAADPDPGPGVSAVDVVTLLDETAASARADAAAAPDGALARLVASIAVSRTAMARALARSAGLAPELQSGAAAPFAVPDTVPPGVAAGDVTTIVHSEDAVGLAYEVMAARSEGDVRARAAARGDLHRRRAEAWAQAGGIAATAADPRRSSYALPPTLTAPDADPAGAWPDLAALEDQLAVGYASLVADTEPEMRSGLIDAVLDATVAGSALTGVVPAFPGMPERAG